MTSGLAIGGATQRYEVLDRLAAGGMAEILAARVREGPLEGRVLVLKRMLPHLARETGYLQMFQDEARILSMLDHPNVVRMYEQGTMDGLPYIAMEYIEGQDARTAIVAERRRGRRVPLAHALAIVSGAAVGLDYAHERRDPQGHPLGIIHRDISPPNILVTYDGLVKVVDFGIAKAQGRLNETRQAMLKGKLPYMSPEQAAGGAIDRRVDVYALGAVLFELTTGRRPYGGKSDVSLLTAILYTPVPRPSLLVAEYPPELERIVLKALAREAGHRHARAEDLRADLLAFARSAGLDTSTAALGRYMQELFSAQVAEIRRARAEGMDLPTVLVGWARESEGAEDEEIDRSGGSGGAPGQPWWVEERKVGEVKIVSLGGRITELFHGAEVAQKLEGKVVLDLSEVERITSFGVREWLRMLDESAGRLQELYLSRCTEAVVNQLRTIRRLTGKGQVVSFYAPYRCPSCHATFEALLEGSRHGELVRQFIAPEEPCPRCGEKGELDDDPRAYFSFATGMVSSAPPGVAAALASLQQASSSVDKAIHGGITRYRVRAPLDEALHWGRILEGAEGSIEVDLGRAPTSTPAGAVALARALRTLSPEVKEASVIAAPPAVLEDLARAPVPRVKLVSARLATTCPGCGASRELELQFGGALPRCASCRGALALGISPAAWVLLGHPSLSGRRAVRAALAATVALGAISGTAALLVRGAGQGEPAAAATVPAWAGGGVADDGERLLVPAKGFGATPAEALAAARKDAVARLGAWLWRSEAPGQVQEGACKLAHRPLPDASAGARTVGHAAAESLFLAEKVTNGSTLHARFALSRAAAEKARRAPAARAKALGMTIARCGEVLVVTATEPSQAAHRAGVRAGDVLARVDDALPASPEEVARTARSGRELKLTLEVQGGTLRTVRLRAE